MKRKTHPSGVELLEGAEGNGKVQPSGAERLPENHNQIKEILYQFVDKQYRKQPD